MKKIISLFLAALLLAGCGACAYAEEGAEAVDYTTGTPWLCIDLEGVVTKDTPASLKDNYALWANKDAILALEIPKGYSSMGTIMELGLKQAEDVKNMFLGDAPKGHGAQFDKDGNMASWWTEEDYAAFLERNAKLEAYYDAMHPWKGQDFHGRIMTGEACADMAGMKAALRIAAKKENFDYDLFFRTYAGIWINKDTLQQVYARLNDNHPMPYLRVNATLQQFDEFLDFYGITEGDGMYLAPEDRVLIW